MKHAWVVMMLLGQSLSEFPFDKGVRVKDEGVGAATLANQARGVTCQGSAVACWVDGGWWFLDVSGGSGGGGSGAPANASYITEVAESGLSNEFAMASLGTGLVKNTTTTGVPSIYAGTSCTNQFPRSLDSSGAASCASVALAADVSGTLPQGNGGTGAGALTCSSGQCLTSNGSAYSCTSTITASDVACGSTCVSDAEISAVAASKLTGVVAVSSGGTGSAPASDDQVLVSDSTSAATWRSVPNCTDTGGNHLNYTTSTNGWSCGTSQLHDVGGSSPQVQYNNSGAFGGIANVESDGTHLRLVPSSAVPAAPSDPKALFVLFTPDSGFPGIPLTVDGFMGLPIPTGLIGAFVTGAGGEDWHVTCTRSQGWGAGTQNVVYMEDLPTVLGNTTVPAWASTSRFERQRRTKQALAGTINTSCGLRGAKELAWRGNAAGAGGWLSWQRAGFEFADAGARMAIGMFNKTTAFSASADPDAELDDVYAGCNKGQTTLHVCSNDNSGTATCSDLGASFPCVSITGAGDTNAHYNVFYDVVFAAAPNASVINYYVKRLDSAAEASGAISSDLPRNTVQMGWQVWANTGSWNGPVDSTFFFECVVAHL
jgi:hypothetical protein